MHTSIHLPPPYSNVQEERSATKLVTLVKELDELLGGGIQPCQLTEVAGVPGTRNHYFNFILLLYNYFSTIIQLYCYTTPGVGKTQISMQLAVNVSIPHALGGCGGEAVYIDTEGSFSAQRTRSFKLEGASVKQRLFEKRRPPQ